MHAVKTFLYSGFISPHPVGPLCPGGLDCPAYGDPGHQDQFVHPCREAFRCPHQNDPHHRPRFTHAPVQDIPRGVVAGGAPAVGQPVKMTP